MRPLPRAAIVVTGTLLLAPVALGATTAPRDLAPGALATDLPTTRSAALDAAAAWRDSLEAYRAPLLPTPSDVESLILVLAEPPAAAADPADRAAVAAAIRSQQDALAPTLASLGATVIFRYRVLVNAVAVSLPAGRLEALAALPEVRAVVPVTFLAPAQVGDPVQPAPAAGAEPAPVAPAGSGPAHIALIDAGVDVAHPWLGGGIGPTFPIVGGADLVDGDGDPRPTDPDAAIEAHGTQMASLVLRSPALQGLAPADVPRLLAYRVVAPEAVGGRLRPLARTDRVLAALERAVDPNDDGDPLDGAEVILLGLAEGFDGGGVDPVSDALAAADRVGATVIAPVGNDGPTFARPGSVGGPAAGPTVIAVGALSAPATPRTAALDVRLGPAAARLGPLPLIGPEGSLSDLPVVVLRDDAGISTGESLEAFLGPDGSSRVRGSIAVVARGGGSIAATTARAAAAGAAGLALWDEDGVASFPAVPGAWGLAIPVVGLGAREGDALVRLTADNPALTLALTPKPIGPAPDAVASFSSWGPTIDGRQKPDLVAAAVNLPAAWPGRGADGSPQSAPLTGTSAAAAQVAALALRLRVDRPSLGPRAVHSLLVQAARPMPEVALQRQGAGVAAAAGLGTVRIEPAIISSETGPGITRIEVSISHLDAVGGPYEIAFSDGVSETILDPALSVGVDGPRRLVLTLPSDRRGHLIVRDQATRAFVARAPVIPTRPARTPEDALGDPEVSIDGRLAEVRVRLGVLRRVDARVQSVRLHGVRLGLVPEGGGEELAVAGAKQEGAWAAGTYRFLVARRLASGLDVPAGRYRLRVRAVGPGGTTLSRESLAFALD